MEKIHYRCPDCVDELLSENDSGLKCSIGHFFPFVEGSKVPVFASSKADINEYTISQAAKIHDNSLEWLFKTFNINETQLRIEILSKLKLQEGQKVLITGTGAGNDLPYLTKLVGKKGTIYAQDISEQMLMAARDRAQTVYGLGEYNINFSLSDAIQLPFSDNIFDSAYHFGGLNLFSDIKKGISEMDRVVKDGGRIVFGDEGLSPWLKDTDYGKMLIDNNPLYRFDAPLADIPITARDVNLSWVINFCFYIIDYTVSTKPLDINIDLKHIGKRGGSIRTRHFGKLEGIDPKLKKKLYATAEKQGLGRVELLESLLNDGLSKIKNKK